MTDATFSRALQRGHSTVYSLTIEGIPYVWVEREYQQTSASGAPAVPAGYLGAVPALLVDDGQSISVELKRESGIASGKAWDIVLSFAALEDAELLSTLFRRPEGRAQLTADVAGDDTVLTVDDTAEVDDATHLYLGRECLAVSGSTATTLTVTRGVVGYPYAYQAQSPSSYRWVTTSPTVWKGRLVTLTEHLVSPEGRLLDGTVGQVGDYSRVLWRGYLDGTPKVTAKGMQLRAQALVRLASQDIGFEVSLETATSLTGSMFEHHLDYPIVVTSADTVRVRIVWDEGLNSGDNVYTVPQLDPSFTPTVMTYSEWWDLVRADLEALVALEPWFKGPGSLFGYHTFHEIGPGKVDHSNLILKEDGYALAVTVTADEGRCYWYEPGAYLGSVSHTTVMGDLHIPVGPTLGTGWLPVRVIAGEGIQDYDIGDSGIGVVDGDPKEILRWSEALDLGSDTIRMIYIAERTMNLTEPAELWADGVRIKALSGYSGTLMDGLLTLLTSSGTGLRSATWDTLELGMGLGVPEAMIDVDGDGVTAIKGGLEAHAELDPTAILVAEGRSSIESLAGGWLSLSGLCLSQADGLLTMVETDPADDPDAVVITADDVLVERLEPEAEVDTPNEVRIDPSGIGVERTQLLFRDTTSVQAEAPRTRDLSVPGIDPILAAVYAHGLISRGLGQSIVRLRLAPWARVQPGQRVRLSLSHPMLYDWNVGARGPAVVNALALGVETNLVDGTHAATFILAGLQDVARYLCPCAEVATVDTVRDVTVDEPQWFAVDDVVTLYTPGAEASEQVTRTVTAIAGATLTFDADHPAWLASGAIVTYPPHGAANDDQRTHAYVRPDTHWSA